MESDSTMLYLVKVKPLHGTIPCYIARALSGGIMISPLVSDAKEYPTFGAACDEWLNSRFHHSGMVADVIPMDHVTEPRW